MPSEGDRSPDDGTGRPEAAMRAPLVLVLVLALLAAGCTTPGSSSNPTVPTKRAEPPEFTNTTVVLETSKGVIAIEMLTVSNVTVANFLQYVEDGYYDGTIFHRVVRKTANESCIGVVQGGGYTKGLKAKQPDLGPIPLERPSVKFRNLSHVKGMVAMARTDEPDTATTQFFIDVEDSTCLDRSRDGYAIFGKVVKGLDVAEAMLASKTRTVDAFENVPEEDIVLRRARVEGTRGPAALELAMLHEGYVIAPDGNLSVALLVKNVGGTRANVTFTVHGLPEGIGARMERARVGVSAGEWIPVILSLTARGASVGVANATLTAKDAASGASATLDWRFRVQDVGREAADAETHPRVQVTYVGLYANGAVFDTDLSLPRNIRVFPGQDRPNFEPLKVYLGDDPSAGAGYTTVIPGFRDAVLGLRVGETRTVRLDPAEAYADGHVRLFEVTLLAIDATF